MAVVICGNCGTENREGRKFCSECAVALAVSCPSCGAPNQPGEKFCGECATPLAAGPASTGSGSGAATSPRPAPAPSRPASAPAPAPAPVSERRVVSILFADLVGFTALSEGRDAEETRELLSRYFDLASDVITRYGGTVEKFIGDAVMAVWGAPVAREDDAERAVRAGLELLDAVQSLGPTIQARAGILTGEAAVTIGATNQGMVAGDLVNTASRLQSVAVPGTVLVGEPTMRAAAAAIAFEEAGPQTLKGKTAPVPAWRALRVVAEIGGRNRSDVLEAPFVGRAEELRLLKDFFHSTSREKRIRLVSLVGPAGIGKSRLAWEFLKYIDGLVDSVWWHQGRSPAYGEGITFWALGEMVRGRCGLAETDDERTTRAKIAETLAEHVPDAEDRRWIEPALLALLGFESGIGSEQLFAAWRTFFERLALTAPVVMVFEDLHWADTGTLDFIDHLLDWSRGLPIYVVTLARPDLLERRPGWGGGRRNFFAMSLDPLSEAAMRELLAGLVPGLPESAVRAIVARADGMPLYAVETVRMLVAEGRIGLRDGIYVPTGNLDSLAVPETLTALIAARLDGLEPADRSLVQDAAVLGQSFTLAGLAAINGAVPAELEPRLLALVRRELLTLEADPRSPERGQYAFVQALIREVAYNTLAKRDRKVRHLAAARFFEALGTDELAGALAGHYLAAHASATDGPEAEALAVQARIALSAAADRAAALGAHDQSLTFLKQALTVTTDPADEAALLERAGAEASSSARHEEAETLLGRAIELHRARGDRPAVARTIAALGQAMLNTYRSDAALALLEPAAAEFVDLGATREGVSLMNQLSRGFYLRGTLDRAVELADQVLAAAERLDLVGIVADALVTRGSALSNVGRTYEGIGVLKAGLELAAANSFHTTALRARNNIGAFLSHRDMGEGLAVLRAGLEESRRLGLRWWTLGFVINAAESALSVGQWDWALGEVDAILATDLEREDRAQLLATSLMYRAFRGQPIDAQLAEYDGLMAGLNDPTMIGSLHGVRANLALAAGRHSEARDEFHALAEITPLNAPSGYPMAARAALWMRDGAAARADLDAFAALNAHGPAIDLRRTTILAGLAALDGRPAEALAQYREALRGWEAIGLSWEMALTAIDMVTLLDPAEPEVSAATERAREILRGLGARPFLDRLDAANGAPEPQEAHAATR